ncbi:MAG: hypothetical protein K6F37_03660 [Lachnospiraceae bacterium]|nr:hypothetical protein [Lachnospiraceae bacterium]
MTNEELYKRIEDSDLLVTDEKAVHRAVGLRYDYHTMYAPEITVIVDRRQMALAKQFAFALGKKLMPQGQYSALLFHNYLPGWQLSKKDYDPAVTIYYKFFGRKVVRSILSYYKMK